MKSKENSLKVKIKKDEQPNALHVQLMILTVSIIACCTLHDKAKDGTSPFEAAKVVLPLKA